MNISAPILEAMEHDNITSLWLAENRYSTVKKINNSRFISRSNGTDSPNIVNDLCDCGLVGSLVIEHQTCVREAAGSNPSAAGPILKVFK